MQAVMLSLADRLSVGVLVVVYKKWYLQQCKPINGYQLTLVIDIKTEIMRTVVTVITGVIVVTETTKIKQIIHAKSEKY